MIIKLLLLLWVQVLLMILYQWLLEVVLHLKNIIQKLMALEQLSLLAQLLLQQPQYMLFGIVLKAEMVAKVAKAVVKTKLKQKQLHLMQMVELSQ